MSFGLTNEHSLYQYLPPWCVW